MTLKRIRYKNSGGPSFGYAQVVYVIINGNQCIFSGITPGPARTSTINAAEDIIMAIAEAEGVEAENLQFFDLQTGTGYEKKPKEYEFDKLLVVYDEKGKPFVRGWADSECPRSILEAFSKFII